MIESISKSKIPSQYAYVLRTELLNNTLKDNNINIHIDVVYNFNQKNESIFQAYFWPPNANIPYNRLYIRGGTLLKKDVFLAREKLKEIVLPEFVVWIKAILNFPENSPHCKRKFCFDASFVNRVLEINNYRV